MSRLKELLSLISLVGFSGSDSPLRLLSLARIYVSLYRFVTVNHFDKEFGNRNEYAQKAEELFNVLLWKANHTPHCEQRSQLISTAYFLTNGTSFVYTPAKMDRCGEATVQLMQDYVRMEKPDPPAQTGVCRCLSEFFYPEAMEEEEWFVYFRTTIEHWARSLTQAGNWSEITHETALERIEVMNRNSYMFLDERYDPTIQRAYSYYRTDILKTLCLPDHEQSLSRLGLLYEAAMQGNAYPVDRPTAEEVAAILDRQSQLSPPQSDRWIYSVSYLLNHLCEEITDRK